MCEPLGGLRNSGERAEKGGIPDSSIQGDQHQCMGKRRRHGASSGTHLILVNYGHSEAV